MKESTALDTAVPAARSQSMASDKLTLGLIASSHKENEKRVAIHPAHFQHFDEETRKHIYAEKGFGRHLRISDDEITPHVAGLMEREEIFERCEAVMIFKAAPADFPFFREGQVLWGAFHNVQNQDIVEVAIEKKLTTIAMEHMHLWNPDGTKGVWLFRTQSELAGYCSTLHALQLFGIKGWHDQPKRCAIISFGSVGRGAFQALQAMDFTDITAFTMRAPTSVIWAPPSLGLERYVRDSEVNGRTLVAGADGSSVPFGDVLADYDIIINAVLQDTDNPMMFIENDQLTRMKRGTLIVDVSCDRGMGFSFARPTTFDEPMFEVRQGLHYYAVDHSPSYLHDTASREHSKEAWPWAKSVIGGKALWRETPTIDHAIDIEDGVIKNRKILTYQNREDEYPHRIRG